MWMMPKPQSDSIKFSSLVLMLSDFQELVRHVTGHEESKDRWRVMRSQHPIQTNPDDITG